jgi:hypothetical protein
MEKVNVVDLFLVKGTNIFLLRYLFSRVSLVSDGMYRQLCRNSNTNNTKIYLVNQFWPQTHKPDATKVQPSEFQNSMYFLSFL